MSRSSIFSSDSFAGFGLRFPATALGVVALLGLIELGLRVVPDPWLYSSSRSRLGVFTFFETDVIPKFEQPLVVVLGTSRAQDAVVPRQLDEALGLPEFSTVNLGIQAGRPYDALRFYTDHRERMKQARLVLLFVDEWHFSSGWGLGWRYVLEAPLGERIRLVPEGRMPELPKPADLSDAEWAERERLLREDKRRQLEELRTVVLTDWAFSMRLKLGYVPSAIGINLLKLGKTKSLEMTEDYQVLRPEKERDRAWGPVQDDAAAFDERIHGFYERFDTHPVLTGHVEQLAKLVKEDGGRLVLIQMPNRRIHQEEVERLYAPHYEQHVAALKDLGARLDVPVFVWRYPEACGLQEISYLDYGHMAREGSKQFTAFLAEVIQKEKLLESKD